MSNVPLLSFKNWKSLSSALAALELLLDVRSKVGWDKPDFCVGSGSPFKEVAAFWSTFSSKASSPVNHLAIVTPLSKLSQSCDLQILVRRKALPAFREGSAIFQRPRYFSKKHGSNRWPANSHEASKEGCQLRSSPPSLDELCQFVLRVHRSCISTREHAVYVQAVDLRVPLAQSRLRAWRSAWTWNFSLVLALNHTWQVDWQRRWCCLGPSYVTWWWPTSTCTCTHMHVFFLSWLVTLCPGKPL